MGAEGLHELFEPTGPIQLKRLFGGLGVYRQGRIIAFGNDGIVWMKTDELTKAAFEKAGSEPFVYERKDRAPIAMSYWRLPDAGFEDPDEMRVWVRLAEEAAARAGTRATAAGRRRKPPKTP